METGTIDAPTLFEAQTLHDNPPPQLLLVQVTDAQVFETAHIKGARNVQPRELVDGTPPATGRLPSLAALEALFSRLGYHPDQTIVVYDDEGGGWAGRLAWTLDVIGHQKWGYLNGGLQAWHAAGLPLTAGQAESASTDVLLTIDPGPIAEIPDVLAAIDDPAQVIWDVRSAEEFLGARRSAARGGHIPTAVNTDWLQLKDPADDQRLIPDLDAFLAARGVHRDASTITHCQTHHRSGLSYMIGRLLGFREIRAYHGSWSEWGNRDDTPITTDPDG